MCQKEIDLNILRVQRVLIPNHGSISPMRMSPLHLLAIRFVTEKEGLTVGQTVKKGDVIATVAEPTGNEYKDGAHLHFEVLENGKSVDPTKHLTLEEK